jgi:hypothetical protein
MAPGLTIVEMKEVTSPLMITGIELKKSIQPQLQPQLQPQIQPQLQPPIQPQLNLLETRKLLQKHKEQKTQQLPLKPQLQWQPPSPQKQQDRKGVSLIQEKAYTRWINNHLENRMVKVNNLLTDLSDGVLLCTLIEIISLKEIKFNKNPKTRVQKIENLNAALDFLILEEGFNQSYIPIQGDIIWDCNPKAVFVLISALITRYHYQEKTPLLSLAAKKEHLEWVRSKMYAFFPLFSLL